MSEVKNVTLEKKDLQKAWWNWITFGQTCYNYEIMQGLGITHGMIPVIEKLYPTKEGKADAMNRHMVYYNTENNWGAAIIGIAASMEEQRANGEEVDEEMINSVKAALMGPLAGIGDTVTQSLAKTIFASIGCSMAMQGNPIGPIFFFVAMSIYCFVVSYNGVMLGYKYGKTAVVRLLGAGVVKRVTDALAAVGMTILGAMVALNVSLTIPVKFTVNGSEVVLQNVLDQILPKMVPLIAVLLTYRFVNKGASASKIVIGMFVVGIVASLLGILA
ncbi:MAG: PTS system mannose/fructose/sorbose family transporter subunit IID [Erysipelotrichaceae bacterium]|nr:PTS system mannose/fructose/sorbose family transporter subunit IID [Erysipelotrichaceae bacterium]